MRAPMWQGYWTQRRLDDPAIVPEGWSLCERCEILTRNGALCGYCVAEVASEHPRIALMGVIEVGPPDDLVREAVGEMAGVVDPSLRLTTTTRWEPSLLLRSPGSTLDRFGGEDSPRYRQFAR